MLTYTLCLRNADGSVRRFKSFESYEEARIALLRQKLVYRHFAWQRVLADSLFIAEEMK